MAWVTVSRSNSMWYEQSSHLRTITYPDSADGTATQCISGGIRTYTTD